MLGPLTVGQGPRRGLLQLGRVRQGRLTIGQWPLSVGLGPLNVGQGPSK